MATWRALWGAKWPSAGFAVDNRGLGHSANARDWSEGRVLRFLVWAISASLRPRVLLVAENVCLRQQLGVLQRGHRQPRLRNGDRQFWICAGRWFAGWRNSLLIVKPETVLRWHRRGWRAYRSWRSNRKRRRIGRRPIPQNLQTLIQQMAVENRLWGQKRIRADRGRLCCIDERKVAVLLSTVTRHY